MPAIALDLGDLAAFLFLLLVAAALWVLIGLINNSLGRAPVIGPWVVRNISGALNDARNAVLRAAGATWSAGVKLFDWVIAFIRNTSNALYNALIQTFIFGERVLHVTLPALENRVLADAFNWASTVQSYAFGLYRSATAYAASLAARAESDAAALFTTARAEAASLFRTVEVDISTGLRVAETDAANALSRARASIAADLAAAEAFAAGETAALRATLAADVAALQGSVATGVATAESIAAARLAAVQSGIYTDLETWGDRAVTVAWPDVAGDIGALRGTLGADFPWLRDLLPALAGAGAIGLAGTLIRSMATSHALTRLADECIVPNCRNLGRYGSELHNLLGDVSTAALLAWLAEAAADPGGWARDTTAVAGPIASGATHAARTLLGVG